MPRVTRKSDMERKFNAFFEIDSTSEESSTEDEILPPKKRKLNDDSKLKLHQLPRDKQKSLETKNYKKHYNEETAYVESVEAACLSQVESSLKLPFEHLECIESEINNMERTADYSQREKTYQSRSVHSYLKYLKECQADKIGYAGSLHKIRTSYKKGFKGSEKRLKEKAKAMLNDVENQYMALQEKTKNDVKEEQSKITREALHNILENLI